MTTQILEITLLTAGGETIKARRCGLDLHNFATEDGTIYQLRQPKVINLNGHPAVKNGPATLMARHLVADAYFPGWDAEYNKVVSIDGNLFNLHKDNLAFQKARGQGRPRMSMAHLTNVIRDLSTVTQDVDMIAEELDVPKSVVKRCLSAVLAEKR